MEALYSVPPRFRLRLTNLTGPLTLLLWFHSGTSGSKSGNAHDQECPREPVRKAETERETASTKREQRSDLVPKTGSHQETSCGSPGVPRAGARASRKHAPPLRHG